METKIKKAIGAKYEAIENNKRMKEMLDQFIGKSETYALDENQVAQCLGANNSDLSSVLRRTLNLKYKPADAAMSLVLRAGIGMDANVTLELIREYVEKVKNS